MSKGNGLYSLIGTRSEAPGIVKNESQLEITLIELTGVAAHHNGNQRYWMQQASNLSSGGLATKGAGGDRIWREST
jgi:hypothetical protein